MNKRKIVVSLLTFIMLIVSLMGLSACGQERDSYQRKEYDYAESLALYENNKPLFNEVVNILISNENFWNNGRQYEDSAHAWIMSPNDTNKMNLFTLDEQTVLKKFFNITRPYMISLDNREYVTITYINEDSSGSYNFAYYFDETKVTNYEQWTIQQKQNYKNFAELGENWFFYY